MTIAADGSIPGDRLYGIDLLIEDVTDILGFTSEHAVERFEESSALLARGDTQAAIDTAWAGARQRPNADWSPDLHVALSRVEALLQDDAAGGTASLAALLSAASLVDDSPGDAASVIAQIAHPAPSAVVGADGAPGLDPDFTPPGQDPDSIPPGQDPDSIPPGQDPDFTPPGQDPDFTPPGQDPDFTPPGQGDTPPNDNGQGQGRGQSTGRDS